MNPFANEYILAEKRLNTLSHIDKTSSCHTSSIPFSKTTSVQSAERRLSIVKPHNSSDAHAHDTNLFISVKQFVDLCTERKTNLPIVDCRSQIDYGCERIRSSHNINCRAKLLAKKLVSKRLEDIEPHLAPLIEHSDRIILYDQSTDVRDEEKLRALPIHLVLQAARRSNRKVFIIQGKTQRCLFLGFLFSS